MGNLENNETTPDKKEIDALTLAETLGLMFKDDANENDTTEQKTEEKNTEVAVDEKSKENTEVNTDVNTTNPPKAQTVQPVQIKPNTDVLKEITKLEIEIEKLEKSSEVDTSEFYDNLDKYLSDDEQQMEFDNKSGYLKLVAQKEKEFVEKNSKTKEKDELVGKKAELEDVLLRQSAIATVVSQYPTYNHEEMETFYKRNLSVAEQEEILANSKTFEDVYINTHKKYLEKNPLVVKGVVNPKIPDVNNIRKQSVQTGDIGDNMKSDDERLREALGV